jgi:hypothetical protein
MTRFMIAVCICGLMAALAAGAMAAPQIVLNGSPEYVGEGAWQYNYTITNYGGTQPINDLDVDASFCYGWANMGCPGDWVSILPIVGPGARWSTEAAPILVDEEKNGFWIIAGTPTFYYGGCQFTTGGDHHVFATGTMAMPIPEPGSLLALGSGLIALAGTFLRKRE